MRFEEICSEILSNNEVGEKIFHLKLKINKKFVATPGQFVMLRVSDNFSPLLRRPFAVFNLEGNLLEINYKIVGKGTELLSYKKPGEVLNIIGPLGKGFKIISDKKSLVIAGGTGIASVFYLLKRLPKTKLLYGVRSKNEIVFLKRLKESCRDLLIATEDGSYGQKGLITSYLKKEMLQEVDILYACGPIKMLKEVAVITQKLKIKCQVSLEAKMACGFGVCLGCVIPSRKSNKEEKEYVRVCYDGPVFDSSIIDWESIL